MGGRVPQWSSMMSACVLWWHRKAKGEHCGVGVLVRCPEVVDCQVHAVPFASCRGR